MLMENVEPAFTEEKLTLYMQICDANLSKMSHKQKLQAQTAKMHQNLITS